LQLIAESYAAPDSDAITEEYSESPR